MNSANRSVLAMSDIDTTNTDFTYPFMVIGNPIEHSRSPRIHQLFAEQTGIDHQYGKYCAELDGFPAMIHRYFAGLGKGVNVTVPFKEEAFQCVDSLTDTAKAAGAVNTIKREASGKLIGHNTDGMGLLSDLQRLGFLQKKTHTLLLGAGGASRGVILPLLNHGAKIVVVNRTFAKAERLASTFSELAKTLNLTGEIHAYSFDELNNYVYLNKHCVNEEKAKLFELIINATSASIHGETPHMPALCFDKHTAVYDMFYDSKPTAFLAHFQQAGIEKYADGLGMLVEQAAYAFEFWHGVLPKTETVLAQLRKEL